MLHIIDGPCGSGKTRKLNSILARYNIVDNSAMYVDCKVSPLPINVKEQALIVDNFNKKSMEEVYNLINLVEEHNKNVHVAIDSSLPENLEILELYQFCDSLDRMFAFCYECCQTYGRCEPGYFTRDGKACCKQHATMYGKLSITLGPMYSGKSTRAIDTIKKLKQVGIKVLVVKHAIDDRYVANSICSHDMVTETCTPITNLEQVMQSDEYKNSKVIVIEEAQFFTDLYQSVQKMLKGTKTVYLYGLNGDFKKQRFGRIIDLIPYAEHVEIVSALCKECKDGTHAHFSKRIVGSNDQVAVGAADSYVAVCRKHHY